jgi:hypothetical protein
MARIAPAFTNTIVPMQIIPFFIAVSQRVFSSEKDNPQRFKLLLMAKKNIIWQFVEARS